MLLGDRPLALDHQFWGLASDTCAVMATEYPSPSSGLTAFVNSKAGIWATVTVYCSAAVVVKEPM